MRLILTLLCAISLSCAGMARAADDMPLIPKSWLDKKITVAEAEAEHPGINDERMQRFPDAAKRDAAGRCAVDLCQSGEILGKPAGRAGIAVVRDGNPVMVLTTMLN